MNLHRNAAKARAKDGDAKAQRAHFGRQRILANSLSKPRVPLQRSMHRIDEPISINLAHARRRPVDDQLASQAFDLALSSTPRKTEYSRKPLLYTSATNLQSLNLKEGSSVTQRELDSVSCALTCVYMHFSR